MLAQGEMGEALHAARDTRLYFDIRAAEPAARPLGAPAAPRACRCSRTRHSACARIGPRLDLSAAEPLTWPLRILIVVGSKAGRRGGGRRARAARAAGGAAADRRAGRRRGPHAADHARGWRRPSPSCARTSSTSSGTAARPSTARARCSSSTATRARPTTGRPARSASSSRTGGRRSRILNACRTNRHDEHEGVWNVSDAFVELGVPAVVAMQGNIRASAAIDFTATLYGALARGIALDVALTAARRRMRDRDGHSLPDFGLPVLQLTRRADAVLRIGHSIADDARRQLEQHAELEGPARTSSIAPRAAGACCGSRPPRTELSLDGHDAAALDVHARHAGRAAPASRRCCAAARARSRSPGATSPASRSARGGSTSSRSCGRSAISSSPRPSTATPTRRRSARSTTRSTT